MHIAYSGDVFALNKGSKFISDQTIIEHSLYLLSHPQTEISTFISTFESY